MTISQMAQMNSFSNSYSVANSSKVNSELSTFQKMLDAASDNAESKDLVSSLSQNAIVSKSSTRLNGDYTSGFSISNPTDADKHAKPQGFAANSTNQSSKVTIDKTSKLYEQSLELENYFVKMMLSSMRQSVKSASGEESFASKMYQDMMYDELSVKMTKNAGFGLADQIYLSLASKV